MSHKKDLVNALTVDEYERCYSRASLVKMLARYGANPHVCQLNFLAGKAAAALRELETENADLKERLMFALNDGHDMAKEDFNEQLREYDAERDGLRRACQSAEAWIVDGGHSLVNESAAYIVGELRAALEGE